ncbi:MAG: hypothetical protein JXR63_06735 [Spirochaetales bacterium]|nr:hypothetical protein [Spirochaetales bacterium]
MKISDIEKLEFEVINMAGDAEVTSAYTSDLLSDVMGNAQENGVLITIQAHKNTVAVASMKDMKAIIICNNREIEDDMLDAAKDEEIAIFKTKLNQFETSFLIGKLLNA